MSISSQKYGFGIRDPTSEIQNPGSGKNLFRIPDPGVKKAPDPGSGSATLQYLRNEPPNKWVALKKLLFNGFSLPRSPCTGATMSWLEEMGGLTAPPAGAMTSTKGAGLGGPLAPEAVTFFCTCTPAEAAEVNEAETGAGAGAGAGAATGAAAGAAVGVAAGAEGATELEPTSAPLSLASAGSGLFTILVASFPAPALKESAPVPFSAASDTEVVLAVSATSDTEAAEAAVLPVSETLLIRPPREQGEDAKTRQKTTVN